MHRLMHYGINGNHPTIRGNVHTTDQEAATIMRTLLWRKKGGKNNTVYSTIKLCNTANDPHFYNDKFMERPIDTTHTSMGYKAPLLIKHTTIEHDND